MGEKRGREAAAHASEPVDLRTEQRKSELK